MRKGQGEQRARGRAARAQSWGVGAQGGEARASCPRSGAPAPAPGAASPKADGLSFPGNLKGRRCPRLASQTSAAGEQTGCRQGADLTEETSGESAWTEVLGEGGGEPACPRPKSEQEEVRLGTAEATGCS